MAWTIIWILLIVIGLILEYRRWKERQREKTFLPWHWKCKEKDCDFSVSASSQLACKMMENSHMRYH